MKLKLESQKKIIELSNHIHLQYSTVQLRHGLTYFAFCFTSISQVNNDALH